jgi:hypothetical protein
LSVCLSLLMDLDSSQERGELHERGCSLSSAWLALEQDRVPCQLCGELEEGDAQGGPPTGSLLYRAVTHFQLADVRHALPFQIVVAPVVWRPEFVVCPSVGRCLSVRWLLFGVRSSLSVRPLVRLRGRGQVDLQALTIGPAASHTHFGGVSSGTGGSAGAHGGRRGAVHESLARGAAAADERRRRAAAGHKPQAGRRQRHGRPLASAGQLVGCQGGGR